MFDRRQAARIVVGAVPGCFSEDLDLFEKEARRTAELHRHEGTQGQGWVTRSSGSLGESHFYGEALEEFSPSRLSPGLVSGLSLHRVKHILTFTDYVLLFCTKCWRRGPLRRMRHGGMRSIQLLPLWH
jgi:hypothetical protein